MAKQIRNIGCGLAALTIVSLCGGLVGFRILRFINSSNRHMTVREVTRFAVPESTFELLHSRIGINPIVAEYNRDITYIQNGIVGKTTPLSIDTCGGYPMSNNDPSTVKVHIGGNVAKPLVQLTSGVSDVYIGRLSGGLDRLRFVPAAKSPESPIRHLMER